MPYVKVLRSYTFNRFYTLLNYPIGKRISCVDTDLCVLLKEGSRGFAPIGPRLYID